MSINPIDFYNELSKNSISFFAGVPDSLLKEFCLCLDAEIPKNNHIITANEGNAIALAAGYYLAKKSLPLVYMQNSGLGNAINPLLSLCDPEVYSIPMIVMIGWRGEPGVKDEPQHVKQGKIQLKLLDAMGIPFIVLSKEDKNFKSKISKIIKVSIKEKRPVAVLIKKGTFNKYNKDEISPKKTELMSREEALEIVLKSIHKNSIIISTTGKTSREVFEIRERNKQSHNQDFLTVGSMGHCSSIALGIAIAKPNRKIVCIDGDGSLLMHFGSLTSAISIKPKNFYHILMNNEVHESVGGQETAARYLNITKIVDAIGARNTFKAKNITQIDININKFLNSTGPSFFEIKIKPGSRKNLSRPHIKPQDNKVNFMNFLKN